MFKIPRGTRDFHPEEMEKRRYIEEKIRSTFKTYGYKEVQTPTFENLDLFTAKSGDAVIDELYSFTDKGGRELALRPELTAPVIRFYVDQLQMNPKPLKLFYFGNCYRYDRPQKGRYREFKQAGCEIIGVETPEAHAELIALSYSIFNNVGLKNIELYIGNLTILSSMFNKLNISKEHQKQLIPLIDKALFEDVNSLLSEVNVKSDTITDFIKILQTSDIKQIKEHIKNDEKALEELSRMEAILELLNNSFKIKDVNTKISIVRGLDYYQGVVFEIEAPVLGAEKQLCGGGAYKLISLFGGRETPTAGFAIGFDRTILALEEEKCIFPQQKTDVYIIPVNEETISKSFEIAEKLRKEKIIVDIDLLRRGVGKSLKYANNLNAKKVIIIGPKELENNSVTIRDMETGNQELVKINDVPSKINNK